MNILKTKLQNTEKLCGTHVSLSDPCVCEILGRLGFDFIWVDCEHSYLSFKDVLIHLQAAGNTPVIVRVQQHDYNFTKKILEMGPSGIIFPMARDAEEVEELMRFTLYPPEGNRGFGPMRAIEYGIQDSLEYVQKRCYEMCRLIQIEQISAVQELPRLVKNKYLDGFIFGPNDLSGSIGRMNQGMHPETQKLIKEGVRIIRDAGKSVGVSLGNYDQETLDYYASIGMNILSTGADYGYILDGAKLSLEHAKEAHRKQVSE